MASSKKSLLFPVLLLLVTVALALAFGSKDTQAPCAATPCDKLPSCCLPKSNPIPEEPTTPHHPISNFILQI